MTADRSINATSEPLLDSDTDWIETYRDFSSALAWLMLAFCLVGIVCNLLSIYIFSRPYMSGAINILLTSLSTVDLVLLLLAIPVFVMPGLNERLQIGFLDQYRGYVLKYLYPVSLMAQTCSIWTMVLITVERWVAVCYPLQVSTAETTSSWNLITHGLLQHRQ